MLGVAKRFSRLLYCAGSRRINEIGVSPVSRLSMRVMRASCTVPLSILSHPWTIQVELPIHHVENCTPIDTDCGAIDAAVLKSPAILKVAQDAGVNRTILYRAFRCQSGPTLSTMIKVLRVLGFQLVVQADRQRAIKAATGRPTRVRPVYERSSDTKAAARLLTVAFGSCRYRVRLPYALVDAAMPPITRAGLFHASKIWSDDALCCAARCRRVALRQRRVAAFVPVGPPRPVNMQAYWISRIVRLSPNGCRRQNRRNRQNRQSRNAHRSLLRDIGAESLTKRAAIPHQSAPRAGRQSFHRWGWEDATLAL